MKLASAEDLLDSAGPWIIPAEIELGIVDTSDAFFTFDFAVPIPCRLVSHVQGIDFDPPALAPGINKVRLKVADIPRDTILWGTVELKSDQVVRSLPLHGRVAIQHPGTAGTTLHLHTLSKEQEAAFHHALHPAPEPVATPAAASRIVPEPPPAAPGKTVPVLPATTAPRRGEEAVVVNAKSSALSTVFSQAEPELPTLVVQPDLPSSADRSKLFQVEAARELEPDEPAKAANPPAKSERLISPLFTGDESK